VIMSETNLQERLQAHLSDVQTNPSTTLDERLFKEAEVFLATQLYNQPAALLDLITALSALLPSLQQDPSPVISLLGKLVDPFSFSDVLQLDPPVDFVAGLNVSAVSFNLLVLQLLSKASQSSKDAAVLANMPAVLHALVSLLLCTPEMGVADKAMKVLVELLRADREEANVAVHGVGFDSVPKAGGQGLLWRRVFGDKDVYGILFSACDLSTGGLSKREKTVAQARLLALLPRIGQLDWNYLLRSHHAEIEHEHGLAAGEGLLDFASHCMVDIKDDVLVHMNLLQFFADLLTLVYDPVTSPSLSYLKSKKLHSAAMSYWLNPDDPKHDPIDLKFLYSASAHYIATYASTYPQDFLQSSESEQIVKRLSQSLDISANQWAHGQSPKHDLNILASLPRLSLLPQRSRGTGKQSSPLLLIPSKITNADALTALSIILHSPSRGKIEELTYGTNGFKPASLSNSTTEANDTNASAIYALWTSYLHYHDSFYADLLTHADTLAFPDRALAAINLIFAIASSQYSPLPDDTSAESTTTPPIPTTTATTTLSDHSIPSHQASSSTSPIPTIPTATQLATLLSLPPASLLPPINAHSPVLSPSARSTLLPWLLRPPKSFAHLVGGRGDAESAAYRAAMARWELVLLVKRKVEVYMEDRGGSNGGQKEDLSWMQEALEGRVRDGIWGRDGAGGEVGGRVATLQL